MEFMRLQNKLSFLALSFLSAGLVLAARPACANGTLPPGALRWTAGNLPPYSSMRPDGPHGYAYELVVLISAKLGRPSEVSFYPWARALRMVRDGTDYGTFPVLRTPEREAQFRWLISLGKVRHVFFARAGSTIDLMNADALRTERIGVLRGSPHIAFLRERKHALLVEAPDLKDLLRLLNEGVVNAIYATESTTKAAIEEFGFQQRDFRTGLSLGDSELFMVASPRIDPAEAERWLKAYRELQQDGTVARLQKKYLVER